MRNQKIIIIALLIFVSVKISAQQNVINKQFSFHSINNIGLLEGLAGAAFQLQTINGVLHKSWFGGIGVGLDYYHYRTIPLFIDVRKEFGKAKNKLFVYADGGVNFGWITEKEKIPYADKDELKKGLYFDTGAGYKIFSNKKNAFIFSAGYSFKKFGEKTEIVYNNPGGFGSFAPVMSNYNYNLSRLTIKAGWEF